MTLLADSSSNGPAAGLGLVVFLILLAGCILLFRSMSGRIKRLPASFEPPATQKSATQKSATQQSATQQSTTQQSTTQQSTAQQSTVEPREQAQ